jgi:hypothetical protein
MVKFNLDRVFRRISLLLFRTAVTQGQGPALPETPAVYANTTTGAGSVFGV